EYRNRLNTLATQKAAGINPYPHKFQQTISYPEYRRKYENLENGEHRDGEQESLSGRVRNIRYSCYVTFCDLHGPSGKVQVMVYRRRPELDKSEISKFRNSVNGGDILGIVAFPGKSAASADNASTPGRGRNPDACILKDPNGSSDLEVLYGPSSMNIVFAKEIEFGENGEGVRGKRKKDKERDRELVEREDLGGGVENRERRKETKDEERLIGGKGRQVGRR
ncbi:lysine--tRNA ligase, partial [Tanacetum coccineum]